MIAFLHYQSNDERERLPHNTEKHRRPVSNQLTNCINALTHYHRSEALTLSERLPSVPSPKNIFLQKFVKRCQTNDQILKKTKKLSRRNGKTAFFTFQSNTSLFQSGQHCFQFSNMVCPGLFCDKNIINVDQHPQQTLQDIFHDVLKQRRSRRNSETSN